MSFYIMKQLAPTILKYCGYKCVVEIGSGGSSTPLLAEVTSKAGVKFYSCDIRREILPFHKLHEHFIMPSLDFIKKFDDEPCLVFLDGNHDYDIVSVEVDFFLGKMVPGGVIFLHDTYPPTERHLNHNACSDSHRVRQEYEKKRDIVDTFTWPYTAGNCGLTMILKKADGRPFYRE